MRVNGPVMKMKMKMKMKDDVVQVVIGKVLHNNLTSFANIRERMEVTTC